MHCPKCGIPAADDQKFCRSCGFGLEKVVLLLEESPPQIEGGSGDGNPNELEIRLNRMDRIWHVALAVLGGAFLTAVCWSIVHFVIIGKKAPVTGGLFLLFLLGLVALGLSGAYVESQRKKLAERQKRANNTAVSDSRAAELAGADTTNKLLPEPDLSSAASVTEETTARLTEKINAAR